MAKVRIQDPSIASEPALYDRLAILPRIPRPLYAHGIAWLSEFIGTTFFLFLALSGEQVAFSASRIVDESFTPSVETLLYASLSYAFAFAASSWIFFRITSGLFNPAVTVGMLCIGSIRWSRAIVVLVAQFLGAMTAAGLVDAVFPGPLIPTMALSSTTSTAHGFFIELFLTMCFVLMVFMMAAEKHKGAFLAPIGLGLALFSVELSSILFTGGSLNPARAFAIALASHQWPWYHWIYWLAPVLGSVPAGLLYKMLKVLEYETATAKHHELQTPVSSLEHEADTGNRSGQVLSAVTEHDVEKGEPAVISK